MISTCLGVGGAERVAVDMVDRFCALGHRVILVSLTEPTILRPQHPNAEVICLQANHVLHIYSTLFQLRNLIAGFQPDVIHAHLFHAILVARLVRLIVRVPCLITTFHSTNVGSLPRRCVYRVTSSLSDLNTAVSSDVRDQFIEKGAVDARQISVLPNGIPTSVFRHYNNARSAIAQELHISEDTFMIVAVGRLEAPKDYPNLLRALQMLKEHHPSFVALIVGEGTLRSSLHSLCRELGVEDVVRFVGLRSDIPNFLSAADIFVLPSEWEGLPRVVGEAMACQAAIVATDSGGVRELTGDTAVLVPPRDSRALYVALHRLLLAPRSEREHMGERARQRIIEQFSLEAVISEWLKTYEKFVTPRAA